MKSGMQSNLTGSECGMRASDRSLPVRRIDGASLHGICSAHTLDNTMRDYRIDVVFKRARE
ncbi:hypothetical protein L2Y90_24930 [Burkholderia pyrrocinia]|uniref:hypothetical protein n=1 Tax=Burkholderia pyrrocinia TaxID=60550 RepID=UPI00215A6D48|nr:hypothetical protein [Burkholderia pyrrocinia]UVE67383.1 hypothetical protein L2Y90_24930 [Burkholderia pyrrocinia]